jgi:hypothetical protein
MSVIDLTTDMSFATLSAAITGSFANDIIQLSTGSYVEDFPDISHNLTIESSGGMAYLTNPQPDPPNGRAVLNVPGDLNVSLTINGLDISGAVDDASNPPSVGGANGAGILFESGNGALTVLNSHIHGNEDGILTGGANASSVNGMKVTIDHSEIDNNGVSPSNPRYGYDHNIYVGSVNQLTVTNSYIHDGLGGNEIKSRALASTIANNRIFDNAAGASYQIDLADGGNDLVENNIIEKGTFSPQGRVMDFGAEGTYPGSTLLVSGNTIISNSTQLGNAAIALYNATLDPSTGQIDTAELLNNTLYGVPDAYQDRYGPPYDILTGNQFLAASLQPPLDTSSLFPVPAPGGMAPVMLLLALVVRIKGMRRSAVRRRFLARA